MFARHRVRNFVAFLIALAECSMASSQPQAVSCPALASAVVANDITKAQAAIRAGCSPNTAIFGSGSSALTSAKDEAMTRALLAMGANADLRDALGVGPLILAVARGDAGSSKALIEAGARVDQSGTYSCGPLCEAAASQKATPEMLTLLLSKVSNVNGTDCWNHSALFVASAGGRNTLIPLLLSKGADVNTYETFQGDTLLINAAQGGDLDTLEMLVNAGAKLEWLNARSCSSALHAAARRGKLAAVRKLVQLGAKVSASDSSGLTARGLAEREGHPDIASYLAGHGAASSGVVHTDCVNAVDSPEAAIAWKAARERTRSEQCRDVTAAANTQGPGR